MRVQPITSLTVGILLILGLGGCASGLAEDVTPPTTPDTSASQGQEDNQGSGTDQAAGEADITIPAGAYAANGPLLFPIPEGWAELDPFVEEKVGKDITISGSVEYPGDAKDAAATYLYVLKAAGFDAYPYAPGELTNQASLAAEGAIGGTNHFALLNFDVHADGKQRVSITITERE